MVNKRKKGQTFIALNSSWMTPIHKLMRIGIQEEHDRKAPQLFPDKTVHMWIIGERAKRARHS